MKLNIKTMTARTFQVEVEVTDSVTTLKERVQDSQGIPPAQQKLRFNGHLLEDDKTIGECGLTDGAELLLMLTLSGPDSPEDKKKCALQ